MTDIKNGASSHRRIRLAPDVRVEKILESALAEFSRHGFASTRIEDIARGANLSKSGFYAHFESKEEVFEALLTRFLVKGKAIPFDASDTVASFVDRFLDSCYGYLGDVHRQAVFRLLLTEAHHIPELIDRWYRDVAYPVFEEQRKVLRAAVKRGQLANTPILEDFSFAYAPAFYLALTNSLQVKKKTEANDLARHREVYRQMMRALLSPGNNKE